ncbi:MAG TPA: TadE family protein [Pirellulales bacterium]|nr:TadE family protein [Pirellulales bacterium]
MVRQRAARARRGAAVVELAFCLPILLTVVFAILEFSRNLQLQQTLREAAFEAARAGIALDASASDVTATATSITNIAAIKSPTITVAPNPLTYSSPTISVTVSTTPAANGWFLKFFNSSSVISTTVTLNREVQSVSVPGSGS